MSIDQDQSLTTILKDITRIYVRPINDKNTTKMFNAMKYSTLHDYS